MIGRCWAESDGDLLVIFESPIVWLDDGEMQFFFILKKCVGNLSFNRDWKKSKSISDWESEAQPDDVSARAVRVRKEIQSIQSIVWDEQKHKEMHFLFLFKLFFLHNVCDCVLACERSTLYRMKWLGGNCAQCPKLITSDGSRRLIDVNSSCGRLRIYLCFYSKSACVLMWTAAANRDWERGRFDEVPAVPAGERRRSRRQRWSINRNATHRFECSDRFMLILAHMVHTPVFGRYSIQVYNSPTTPVLENPEYQTRWYFKYFLGKCKFRTQCQEKTNNLIYFRLEIYQI